jgi:DNA-binding phage protein
MAAITRLIPGAHPEIETAESWYDSYGWHLTTDREGDVELQAVDYDWLDGTDDEAVDQLVERYPALRRREARAIVERAREVRETADAIEGMLSSAVEAYERGDLDGVLEALREATRLEGPHGASPATDALRAALVEEIDEDELAEEEADAAEASVNAELPETVGMPREVLCDYLADRGHPAAETIRRVTEAI